MEVGGWRFAIAKHDLSSRGFAQGSWSLLLVDYYRIPYSVLQFYVSITSGAPVSQLV